MAGKTRTLKRGTLRSLRPVGRAGPPGRGARQENRSAYHLPKAEREEDEELSTLVAAGVGAIGLLVQGPVLWAMSLDNIVEYYRNEFETWVKAFR